MIYKLCIFSLSFLLAQSWSNNCTSQIPGRFDDKHEVLNYKVRAGIFGVGEASITIGKRTNNCSYTLDAEAWTIGLVKVISKVHYHFRTCIDERTGLPAEAIRYVMEGKEESYEIVQYDHVSREDSTIIYRSNYDTVVVKKGIYDIMSGYLHFWKDFPPGYLEPGQEIKIHTYFIDEVFDLRLVYTGKETIETKKGIIRCYKYMPITEAGRFFKTENAMTMWITDDEDFLPVRIKLDLRVGSLTGDLIY